MKIGGMGAATIDHVGLMAQADTCRLVVRKEKGLHEIIQFVVPGLEIGQQVVVVADPSFLNNIARGLSEYGLRPDVFLHSGRLVFLTAPDCLNELLRAGDSPTQPLALARNSYALGYRLVVGPVQR